LLKNVEQPELFRVHFPELKKPEVKPDEDSLMVRSMKGFAVNNLVLLLDVSGSMNAPGKLPLLKKSFADLISIMRPEDQVAIVIFSTKGKVVLTSTSFSNSDKIRNVIENLKPVGNTDGNAGLRMAFEVADKNYIRGGNNRIILATDGEFPVSEASQSLVSKFAQQDIFITVFNFNPSEAPGKNLEKLAGLGKGNYKRVTAENVDESLLTEVKAKKQ
jgi:Mg-chelatase subunit ChlD